jgi:hypothetical protein
MAARRKLSVGEKLRDGQKVISELAGATFNKEAGLLSCTLRRSARARELRRGAQDRDT